ncbi:MAG: hypothetical protein KBF75_13860 [Saprospiraceae bacterium]|nr:hypothetical protein [Saprospiraceae bacterium]MCA0334981.1 hypothetical protein [Bacteroidota bacterium]
MLHLSPIITQVGSICRTSPPFLPKREMHFTPLIYFFPRWKCMTLLFTVLIQKVSEGQRTLPFRYKAS